MKNKISQLLQDALNSYLALDPETPQRLNALQGKVVTIELLRVGFIFQLIFADDALKLKFDSSMPADTVIKGTPLRLWHMTVMKNNRKAFFSEDVSITGNVELGQQVIDLFDHLEIDWEEYASRWIGDVSAHHLGSISARIKNISEQIQETLAQNVNEYVHEEVNWFPPKEALNDYFHDVDSLRMDVDRLEARVKQLQAAASVRRDKL